MKKQSFKVVYETTVIADYERETFIYMVPKSETVSANAFTQPFSEFIRLNGIHKAKQLLKCYKNKEFNTFNNI